MKQKKIHPLIVLLSALLIVVVKLTQPSPAFAASVSSTNAKSFEVSTCLMMPSGSPQIESCGGLSGTIGQLNTPIYVQDTEPGTCANWHISIDGAKPFEGCAEHMLGSNVGNYIVFGPDAYLNEYQITAIQNAQQQVAVTFVQEWVPDGTEQHPYLLLLYPGICSDVWSVAFASKDVGRDPLCTRTMAVSQQGQYVEVAGAGEEGEFFVQTVNLLEKSVAIA